MKLYSSGSTSTTCLPDSNSNKIPANLQGMMLHSQIYGSARDVCLNMSSSEIQISHGAMQIAKAMHKSDPLSLVNNAFRKSQEFLSIIRGSAESMINFERLFDAALCRLNVVCKNSQLPNSTVAFLALSHANIYSSHLMSISASVLSKSASSRLCYRFFDTRGS